MNHKLIALGSIFLWLTGCGCVVEEVYRFKKRYQIIESTNNINPVDHMFPMAGATDVVLTVNRKEGLVMFQYMMGETEVTETWRMKSLSSYTIDECQSGANMIPKDVQKIVYASNLL